MYTAIGSCSISARQSRSRNVRSASTPASRAPPRGPGATSSGPSLISAASVRHGGSPRNGRVDGSARCEQRLADEDAAAIFDDLPRLALDRDLVADRRRLAGHALPLNRTLDGVGAAQKQRECRTLTYRHGRKNSPAPRVPA